MNNNNTPLSGFHPIVARWFTTRVGTPTDVQAAAWPKISLGQHLLVTAPTGSGKTLTAFLWAINQLLTGAWETGCTRVLYISPLKALNNDIRRNLLQPLAELRQAFEQEGETFPLIRVLTRSGDTPQSDRRQMQRHPPEILITTPESLHLLLSSPRSRPILTQLSTVVLDEIHSVVNTKRGVLLMSAVERLVPLSGEFQRLALSATVRPLETVAELVGGWQMSGPAHSPRYTNRDVTIIRSSASKHYDLRVRAPATEGHTRESVWDPIVDEFKRHIGHNRSTLVFTKGRKLCEKLTHMINRGEPEPIAYSHHGSLSRELRTEVEQKLKAGELKAIVATSSLEMGIDIGALDEVILVQTPPSVSSAIQRVGRAGHQVGETSRASLFPTYNMDFLEAATLVPEVLNRNIEAVRPIRCPLDVLAQLLVSMVGVETWDIDQLYAQILTSYPYRHLSREHFDLVLNMLAGRYADSRIRELKPRVSIDRLDNTVVARRGALQALYMSGGVIPDRGYYHMRHRDTSARIGELDEEFVWEANVGQVFTLGTQNWKIERITHNDVFVSAANPNAMAPPFWRAETNNRDFHFSECIGRFLETANERLTDPDFAELLEKEHRLEPAAVEELLSFLSQQKERTGRDLPHRHHILLEFVSAGPGSAPGNQLVIHTIWGGRVNRPYAMALEAAWEDRFGQRPEVFVGNDCISIILPQEVGADEVLSLVHAGSVETHLRKRLEGSGYFGAFFREAAGRALLLTRNKMNQRLPLWMSRLRAQKLVTAISQYDDFPILLEAWRACLQDEFEMEALHRVLSELETGAITWSEVRTNRPSPMAQGDAWRQVNLYMYMDDTPQAGKTSSLRQDLLRDVVFTEGLRPTISPEVVREFQQKRQRLSPGYSPASPRELVDWVVERLAIPWPEWKQLTARIREDHGADVETWLHDVGDKLVRLAVSTRHEPLIVALEQLPHLAGTLFRPETGVSLQLELLGSLRSLPSPEVPDAEDDERQERFDKVLGEWLQFYGPFTLEFVVDTLGLAPDCLSTALEDLVESQVLINGQLTTEGAPDEYCESENFEILLRKTRARAIPVFEPLDAEWLPLFLATHQGLGERGDNVETLMRSIEQLVCYPGRAEAWETEFFPARQDPYSTAFLDSAMQEGDLRWLGIGDQKVTFCFAPDMELLGDENGAGFGPAIDETDDSDDDGDGRDHGDGRGHGDGNGDDDLDEYVRRGGIDQEDNGRQAVANEALGRSLEALFSDSWARYDFGTLLRLSGKRAAELSDGLWEGVWQGRFSNDTFLALRKGIENKYKAPDFVQREGGHGRRGRPGGRSGFSRWKGALPFAGNWYRLEPITPPEDLLEREERNKERVRILLERYGILFRELLERELPPFRWSRIFRTLRLMELSGELLAGCFFHGIPGPQFVSHQAFRHLQRALPEDRIFWLSAIDPASFCGSHIEPLHSALPRRIPGTHLIYHGRTLVLVSKRQAGELIFNVPADFPHIQSYLGFLRHLLSRQFQPVRRLSIETINGEEAARSPYVDALRTHFDVSIEFKKVSIYRKLS